MENLRFLHIPKTAGSTFTSILDRQYRGKGKFNFTGDFSSDIKKYQALSEDERENLKLFTGHSPIITGIREVDEITIITFLRDPISRVKSYCQYVSEGKVSGISGNSLSKPFILDDFLESGNAELSNLQTKMLVNTNKHGASPLEGMLAEARDKALENLFTKISFFGIQEYFDESLMIFQTALNWKTPFYASIGKKNPKKLIKFKKHHLERIAELNVIDMEVYNVAKARFLETINGLELYSAEVKRFRLVNSLVKHVINLEYMSIGLYKYVTGRKSRSQ